MRDMRAAVAEGRFLAFKAGLLAEYPIIPHEIRAANRARRRAKRE
jgi:hypothetical protein